VVTIETLLNIIINLIKQMPVWVLFLIIIAIGLKFYSQKAKTKKKYKKRTNTRDSKELYQKNIKKGKEYEDKVGLYYEQKGYEVEYRGAKYGRKDKGIDLIAKNKKEILFIQCKNWTGKNSITHNIAKEIYGNCSIYVKKHKMENDKNMFILAIPSKEILSKAAEHVFIQNYKDCRYKIIK